MRDNDIQDFDIPGADPAAVVAQYEPLIKKVANHYISILGRTGAVGFDDLQQVGRLAVLRAQSKYDPAQGSFVIYSALWISSAMRRALGFSSTGAPPVFLDYLDEPITDDEGNETARIDLIPDPAAEPFDETIIDAETRQKTAVEVRAALDRLKNDRQRDTIQRIYFDGQQRQEIAAAYGVTHQRIGQIETRAYRELRHDTRLRKIAAEMPSFHVSKSRFNCTWTSETEAAVIWRDEHLPQDRFAGTDEPGRTWTAVQWQSYAERIRRKWARANAEPEPNAI